MRPHSLYVLFLIVILVFISMHRFQSLSKNLKQAMMAIHNDQSTVALTLTHNATKVANMTEITVLTKISSAPHNIASALTMTLAHNATKVANMTETTILTNSSAPTNITSIREDSLLQASVLNRSKMHYNVGLSGNSSCLASIQNAMGIYENPTQEQKDRFANAVLVTAVDHGFIDLYYNWLYYVKRHGLKHVVFALDEPSYQEINYSVPFFTSMLNGTKYSPELRRRDRKRHVKIVCSKLQLKLEILQQFPGMGMVFSDVDVVMLQDPFQHDLGRLMGGYDYVYTVESDWKNKTFKHGCFQSSSWPRKFKEGNTGFDYASSTKWIIDILAESLNTCEQTWNNMHDQKLFWDQMRRHQRRKHDGKDWTHCDKGNYANTNTSRQDRSLCCLDPHQYPNGGKIPKVPVVTFHANLGTPGLSLKIEKLRSINAWNL